MAANLKLWPGNRLGLPFRDKGLEQTGLFCDKPLRDKPLEDYSTLHRGSRQGLVTEGLRQRFVREGGVPRQHGVLIHTHMSIQEERQRAKNIHHMLTMAQLLGSVLLHMSEYIIYPCIALRCLFPGSRKRQR